MNVEIIRWDEIDVDTWDYGTNEKEIKKVIIQNERRKKEKVSCRKVGRKLNLEL